MIFLTDEELIHECNDVIQEPLPDLVPVPRWNLIRLQVLSGIDFTWESTDDHVDVPKLVFLEMVIKAGLHTMKSELELTKNKNPA